MPRKARPASSPGLEDPVEALGSMLRAGIIGYLRSSGPARRAELARALELRPVTVAKALSSLHSAGLFIQDPPPDQVRPGPGVPYRVKPPTVSKISPQPRH